MWGTEEETTRKVSELYSSGIPYRATPVPGAKAALSALCALGFRLAVVTAREASELVESQRWLDEHFPGRLSHLKSHHNF